MYQTNAVLTMSEKISKIHTQPINYEVLYVSRPQSNSLRNKS